MSSSSNQNPNLWSPYKDCSQGVCSIYCPQWCYIIFPPPPPSGDSSSVTDLSPLVIAVIGILASACILVSYYAFVSRYCKRRPAAEANAFHAQPPVSAGLDESVIKTIAVCRYKKSDGFMDCPVCLSEFEEGETLRLLPKCCHAFHLPCIDPWLKNQASCPLCRSDISSFDPLPVDTVVEIEIDDLGLEAEHSGSRGLRRSVSLDSAARQEAHVRISDILEASDDDDDDDDEYVGVECGSSRDKSGGVNMAVMMKRSTSTGRFTFSRSGKGRSSSSIHP